MNEDDLRIALTSGIPEPPATNDWAAQARRRSRRDQTLASGTVVAALVAVTALVAGNVPGLGGGTLGVPAATPSVSPSGTTAPAADSFCADHAQVSTLAGRDLPAGATSVRLCADGRDPADTLVPPLDTLTLGVDQLAESFNLAPAAPKDRACDASVRSYRVVFGYPDRAPIVLRGTTGPCATIGGVNRDSVREGSSFFGGLRKIWAAGRELQPPPAAPGPEGCRPIAAAPALVVIPNDVTGGTLCSSARGTQDVTPLRPLTPDQARSLAGDLLDHSRIASNIDSPLDGPTLTLTTRWGDAVVAWRVEGNQWFAFTGVGREQRFWQPSAAARRLLDYLIAGATPSHPGTLEPADPNACDGLVPTGPGVEIPTQALRLRLCAAGAAELRQWAPAEPLETQGAARVLQVLAAQPTQRNDQACTDELGPEFLLVAEFSGREPVAMPLRLYGCRTVGTPDDQRTGAEKVLEAFRTELVAQRAAAAPPSPPVRRTESLCAPRWAPHGSVMPMVPDDLVAGVVCRWTGQDQRGEPVTRSLTAAQVATIVADLKAHSEPSQAMPCPGLPPGRPTLGLALTNAWGDVLAVSWSGCPGSYTYLQDGKQLRWTPSEATAALLDRIVG